MANAKRIVSTIFGIMFLLISIGLILGGTVLVVAVNTFSDSQGYITPLSYTFSDPKAVAVTGIIPFSDWNQNGQSSQWSITTNPGDFVSFRINALNEFIGIGPKADVESYLSNSSYILINSFNFNCVIQCKTTVNTTTVNTANIGTLVSSPPSSQAFWTITNHNSGPLVWAPTSAQLQSKTDLMIVVMNSNGSAGINNVPVSVGVKIPILMAIGIGLLVFGIIFFILSIVLFVVAVKAKGARTPITSRIRYYQGPVPMRVDQGMKFCSNCGSRLDADARFCSGCGEPVFEAPIEGIPSPKAMAATGTPPVTSSTATSTNIPLSTTTQTTKQFTVKNILPVTSPQLPANAYIAADWVTRFWAYLIDFLIVNAAVEFVRWTAIMLTGSYSYVTNVDLFSFGFGVNGVVMLLYFGIVEGKYSTTLGKQALGLITVSESTGNKINFGEAFLSAIGKAFLLPLDIIIGLLMKEPPTGRQVTLNQRLFQRISRTVTVYRPPVGAVPGNNFLNYKLHY